MKTLLAHRSTSKRSSTGQATLGRAGRLVATLICALATWALLAPASAAAATTCPVHGLTIHAGKVGVDVVGLSAQGVSCQKAVDAARQVAHGLAGGSSLNLAGPAGIAVATTTPCEKCATQTHVTLSYPTGTIKMTLKGATKLFARAGAAIPFPTIPFPRIPGFQFPSFPRFPNIPNFPSPVPSNGTTTV
jgi:hypothetical protein